MNAETMSEKANNMLPLTRIQKLIGGYMQHSKETMPCSYMLVRVDVTQIVRIRKPYCKRVGSRVTTNDFFFCAIAQAIKDFPLMAGGIDEAGETIDIASQAGIGFAVAAPQGLVVPVIKDVTGDSLPEMAKKSDTLVKKARANKLMPDDFDGASVVISSLGMYNIYSFYAIAPPGSSGIISMGKIDEHVVPIDGSFVSRKFMTLGIAADRRFISDIYAARFMNRVKEFLEIPEKLTGEVFD